MRLTLIRSGGFAGSLPPPLTLDTGALPRAVASRIEKLYKIRVTAVYVSSDPITSETVNAVRRDSGYIISVAQLILTPRTR